MRRLSGICLFAFGAALQALAQVPLEIKSPPLAYRGTAATPLEISAPALVYRESDASPLGVSAPALVYRGPPSAPLAITAPSLVFRGNTLQPFGIEAPALVFRSAVLSPLMISTPSLIYRDAAKSHVEPSTSVLEIIDVPTDPVSSTYLSLDSAAVDTDQGMTLTYSGLPAERGYGGLIFMDETPPRLAAWFYTAANRPEGKFERGRLPPLTGNWKACIGFAPLMNRAVADVSQYADCLDFVVAGPSSIGAQPTLALPDTPLKAGHDVTLTFGSLPPANCAISIYDTTGTLVASHYTNRKPDDSWTLRFSESGTYELTITYHGSAVRARAKLEVFP